MIVNELIAELSKMSPTATIVIGVGIVAVDIEKVLELALGGVAIVCGKVIE